MDCRRKRARHGQPRGRAERWPGRATGRRHRIELLESRLLLAADLAGWPHDIDFSEVDARRSVAEGESTKLVRFGLFATDTKLNPITNLPAGSEFLLNATVQDIRGTFDDGVFSAYLDVAYDADLVEPVLSQTNKLGFDIVFGPKYPNGLSGNVDTVGLIDEVGAFQTGLQPLGSLPQLLFRARMQAGGVFAVDDRFESIQEDAQNVFLNVLANDQVLGGTVTFRPNPADISPAHDVLLFNPATPVPPDMIDYIGTQLQIVDGGGLQVTEVGTPDQGGEVKISVAGDGVLYTPAPNFAGEEHFTYKIKGGFEARVTVVVDPVNDRPIALDDHYALAKNQTITIDKTHGVLANDSDVEQSPLTARLTTPPQHGTVSLAADGSFTYTPEVDFRGIDQFQYVANDGQLDSTPATVKLAVDPPSAQFRLQTTSTDGTAISQITAGQAFQLRVHVQDIRDTMFPGIFAAYLDVVYDADAILVPPSQSNPLGFDVQFFSGFENGTDGDAGLAGLLDNLGAFQSQQAPTGSDEQLLLAATLRARAVDTVDDAFTGIAEDSPEVGLDVLANDIRKQGNTGLTARPSGSSPRHDVLPYVPASPIPDDNQVFVNTNLEVLPANNLIITAVSQPDRGGKVRIAGDGKSVLYQPAADFFGVETFTYTVAGEGASTASVTVDPVNDPPIAVDDRYRVRENLVLDVPVDRGVLSNDADPEGDAIKAVLLTDPQHGTVTLRDDGSFVYTPESNFMGPDSFTYQVSDGTLSSSTATVHFDFDPAPVRLRLDIQDDAGNVRSQVTVGDSFWVATHVQDMRDGGQPALGVFAAYLDVLFPTADVQAVPDPSSNSGFRMQLGPRYDTGGAGTLGDGVLNEVGSFQLGLDPLGGEELLLFRAEMTAANPRAGDDAFNVSYNSRLNPLDVLADDRTLVWDVPLVSESADVVPDSDVLLFNPPDPVPTEDVHYGRTAVSIRNRDDLRIVSITQGDQGGLISITADNQQLIYTPPADYLGAETFTYVVEDDLGGRGTGTVTLNVVHSWQNLRNPLDVNADGLVSPLDALNVINDINALGSRALTAPPPGPPFIDVSGDKFASPVDALIVINFLNRQAGGEAELALPASGSNGLLVEPAAATEARSELAEVAESADLAGPSHLDPLWVPQVGEAPRIASEDSGADDQPIDPIDELDRLLDELAGDISQQWWLE